MKDDTFVLHNYSQTLLVFRAVNLALSNNYSVCEFEEAYENIEEFLL